VKILFTSNRFSPDIGGIESVSELLASEFVVAGHDVCLLTQTPAQSPIRSRSFPFPVIRQPGKRDLLSCFRWADVVFQNNIEARLLWPNLFFRKPLVIALHTWIRSSQGQIGGIHFIKKALVSMADQSIACSAAIRSSCDPTALVIGNPYNQDLFRLIPGLPRDRQIVFLGRLVSDKGADLLLEAIALFAPPRPTLTIIGSGPEQASLRHRVRDLQIADSVVFSGPLEGEALVRSLHAHQVMVIPSVWEEPFGMVALEGIACGCVVLASDGGGLPDAVGAAGLLFQRGDVESLHCNLQLLLKDPALRSELRAQAPAHLRNFQPKQVSSRYLDVLEHAVQSRKKGTL